MLWIIGLFMQLIAGESLGMNLGYKVVGGGQKSQIKETNGLGVPEVDDDQEFKFSPKLSGYLMGVTVYMVPFNAPFWLGAFVREKSLRQVQNRSENESMATGLEMSVWYPHPLVQPFFSAGLGVQGKGSLKSEYLENDNQGYYEMEGSLSSSHAAIGLKMPSTKDLSAYLQWEIGNERINGKLFWKEVNNEFAMKEGNEDLRTFPDAGLTLKSQSLLIGIDYAFLQ